MAHDDLDLLVHLLLLLKVCLLLIPHSFKVSKPVLRDLVVSSLSGCKLISSLEEFLDLIAVGNDLVLSFSAVFLDGLSVLVSCLLQLSNSILVSLGGLGLGGRLGNLGLELVSKFLLDLVVGLV